MASSSNPPDASARIQDFEYLYASNTNVSNFVSVKLSGHESYHLWKRQMLCLMEAHEMRGLVDGGPTDLSTKMMKKYGSLLRGWIFGSVSEDVLRIVVDHDSAKVVWDELKRYFDSTESPQQDSTPTKADSKTEMRDKNVILGEIAINVKGTNSSESEAKGQEATQIETEETETNDKVALRKQKTDVNLIENEIKEEMDSAESKAECEDSIQTENQGYTDSAPKVDMEIVDAVETAETETNELRQLIVNKNWYRAFRRLKKRNALTEKIDSDGNTLLHIAAVDGDKFLAELLVTENKNVLYIKDNEGHTPLDKANENGHRNIIAYLKGASKDDEICKKGVETETKEFGQLVGDGEWYVIYLKLKERNDLDKKINSDGSTLLHIAVEIGDYNLIEAILWSIPSYYDLTRMKNKDGSTVLHIAAIVGNTEAAKLLVKHEKKLLDIKDYEGKTPIDKAYENGHLNTIAYLEEAAKILRKLIVDGDWNAVFDQLRKRDRIKEKINSDGNTLLHIVVGIGDNDYLLKKILRVTSHDDLTQMKNSDGSTVLHIAAIVGNTKAAELLVKKNEMLLHIHDNKGQTPLDKAYENMHLDMIANLLKAAENHEKRKKECHKAANVDGTGQTKADVDGTRSTLLPSMEIGVDLLVNAISAKRYDLATTLISRNPEYAVSNDNVLMAIARTFPDGLDYGERLIYPSLANTCGMIVKRTKGLFNLVVAISSEVKKSTWHALSCGYSFQESLLFASWLILVVPAAAMVYWIYHLIPLLLLMVYFPFFMLYFLWWKVAGRVVPPFKNIEQKKKDYKEAKKVLELVLETIMEKCPSSSPDLYTGPILEAACQDAYEVVVQILGRWTEAIRCKDKNGYDIIQLATIHRSERIYNLIYIMGERKSIYRTKEDSSMNNMLHLAGRLAPSNKLKRRTGAALQLQRELQWRQEVEKLVFPTFITKENIFMETPELVFTKEHEDLVKEGEKWIKTVAESCSITAALIITIVFAAAITVPGGSNQNSGIPLFTKHVAFTTFAIADAISLFSSATALLVFLSILTARFAEHDFLKRLPIRLIIGLCSLLISTTAMIVAFSATLFLVFSREKQWVLAPICALALIPIGFFFVLQFPLILDLLRSTYIFKFGKSENKSSKLIQNDIRFILGK